ncbi:hypothetical protein FRB93_004348 [Tulasnella sp. JGI-2019a]|nr:hypothetical protein FRB93_004348 [Tulasnella sp. JGI-2019a]
MASHRKLHRSPSPQPDSQDSPSPEHRLSQPYHQSHMATSSYPPPHPPHPQVYHGHVPPHHHHQYPPLLPPPHPQHPHDMAMAHSHPYPPPDLQHHHQSHPYSQSASDMPHPYTSPYPVLPPPQVPARNGGVGTGGNPNRKRKKADSPDDSHQQQPPARRLRRLHEACTRCRTKKIKCDSKLPSCSACTAAHVECNQEDRHRQTLKPRGYTDKLEVSLVKCIMVLQRLVPGFEDSPDVDALFERQNLSLVDVDVNTVIAGILAAASGIGSAALGTGSLAGLTAMKQEPHTNTLSLSVEGGGSGSGDTISAPVRMREPEQPQRREPQAQTQTSDSLALQAGSASGSATGNKSSSPANPEEMSDVKGQDPQSNDLSGLPGLIKAFGVSRHIVKDLPRPGEPIRLQFLRAYTLFGPRARTRCRKGRTLRSWNPIRECMQGFWPQMDSYFPSIFMDCTMILLLTWL